MGDRRMRDVSSDMTEGPRTLPRPSLRECQCDRALFWQLVDDAEAAGSRQWQAEYEQSVLGQPRARRRRSVQCSLHEALDALYTWELWAVAYVVQGGRSDGAFEYVRAWVISSLMRAGQLLLLAMVILPAGLLLVYFDFVVAGKVRGVEVPSDHQRWWYLLLLMMLHIGWIGMLASIWRCP
jgi:hypothetical protein